MKKIVEVFSKEADHPITYKEIDIELLDDDIFHAGYEEPYYGSDSGHDGYYFLEITRYVEETEEEIKQRQEAEKLSKKMLKKRRYEHYLKLREEFEQDGVHQPIVDNTSTPPKKDYCTCTAMTPKPISETEFECLNCGKEIDSVQLK